MSTVQGIEQFTFNTGHNSHAAQFTESRLKVANFIQRGRMEEGYLVAETIRTGTAQTIGLPAAVDPNAPDAKDLETIRTEMVKTVAKRRQKLEESIRKGYATVYEQCSQQVKDKLEGTADWERTQNEQLLHKLINKIERICVGFDDHKQGVFNLVQSLKTLFLYTQTKKEKVETYGRNFRSLWETVEAFGGSPGIHEGLVAAALSEKGITTPSTALQRRDAEESTCEAVKAALLISGADKRKFGKLKDELANDFLLGTNHYPDTYDKAMRILTNYQSSQK